jgi:hypothetical protein
MLNRSNFRPLSGFKHYEKLFAIKDEWKWQSRKVRMHKYLNLEKPQAYFRTERFSAS